MTKQVVDSGVSDADGVDYKDVDGDGKRDFVVGDGADGDVAWYEQGADAQTWTRHAVASGFSEIEGMAAGDVDGDGIMELVICDQGGNDLAIASADTSDPTGSWSTLTLDSSAKNCTTARVIDINNDGNPDVVYSYEGNDGTTGGLYWFEFSGGDPLDGSNWTKHEMFAKPGAYIFSPTRQDYSGDGNKTDFVLAARYNSGYNSGAEGGLHVVKEPSDVTSTWNVDTYNSGETFTHVSHGDLTGDGDTRDALVRGSGNVYEFLWDSGTSSFSKNTLLSSKTYHNAVALDASSSDIYDMVTANKSDNKLELRIYDSDTDSWPVSDSFSQNKSDDELIPYDVNGDGTVDVATVEANGSSVYWGKIEQA